MVGCTKWAIPAGQGLAISNPRLAPDSVTVEIATFGLPVVPGRSAEYWLEVDEQAFSLEKRQHLAESGLRCGILDGQLPQILREKLDSAATDKQKLEGALSLDDSERVSQKRLQNQAGRRSKIVIGEAREKMIVLLPNPNGLRGESFEQAQCLFSLKSFPQGDGRVKLELTPEIEHGAVKQRVIGQAQDGAFRLDAGKDRAVFEQQRISVFLSAGQTLIVTSTPEAKGLGRQFFAETNSTTKEERILLIRLAHSQVDDLFQTEEAAEPLTTLLD